jgi:hypothetical protein
MGNRLEGKFFAHGCEQGSSMASEVFSSSDPILGKR